MNAPLRGLHDPVRTLEQAEADRIEARQGGWPMRTYAAACREVDRGYLPDSPAIAELGKAIIACAEVVKHLVEAERHLPVGDGLDDELRGMADMVSDIRGRITREERR